MLMAPGWLVTALALVAFGAVASADAAATTKSCRSPSLYPPKNGGFALIIEHLKVKGVTCARGVTIAGAHSAGDASPSGWKCRDHGIKPTVCMRARARVTYVSGGDAG